jgi:hypothetical protein
MLRGFFGESAAAVEDAFGSPSSVRQADSLPPQNTAAGEQERSKHADRSMVYAYSTVDGELVFRFNSNGKVCAITYAGRAVSPPGPSPEATREVEDGGDVKSEGRDRVNAFFLALGEARSADEEKAVVMDLARWLEARGYTLEVEERQGKHVLACPYFPPITPWISHRFLDLRNLELLPRTPARKP